MIIEREDMRLGFIHRDDQINRQQLDAQGTTSATVDFWTKVAHIFNDTNFVV